MAVTTKFRPAVYSPQYRQMRFAPVDTVTTALSCSCVPNNTGFNANAGRYVYFLFAAAQFVKFDTWTQTSVELSSPPIATATYAAMEFVDTRGFETMCLSGGSLTVQMGAYSGQTLVGYEIEIVSGTGAGQRRVITAVAEPVVALTGVCTAITNAQGTVNATDTLQAMTVNQYANYQWRVSFGSGVGQARRILYNSATEFFLGDSTKSADDYNCNPGIFAPAISATAGSQSIYSVESSVVTINAPWTTIPDTTSRVRVSSGGIFLYSSAAATPFYTLQYYDVLTDVWYIRSACELMMNVVAADASMEHSPEAKSIWWHSIANGTQSGTTLQDLEFSFSTPPNVALGSFLPQFATGWAVNQWTGYSVFINSGTGAGQIRLITSNTANTLTVPTWGTMPDATSEYMILGYAAGTSSGSNGPTTFNDTAQAWVANAFSNYAVCIIYGTGVGQIRAIASNTATQLTTTIPFSTLPDSTSVYAIIADPDKMFTISSNNTVLPIHNIEDDLMTLGRLQDSGTAGILAAYVSSQAEAPRWRGPVKPQVITGITQVTTTATATTANAHNFKVGQAITVVGATSTGAADYNGAQTIATVPSITTFTYTMSGSPGSNATGSAALSTTNLTDPTKNWTTNQFVGMLCTFNTSVETAASGLFTMATAEITANSSNTLTLNTTTAPVAGESRYVIHPMHCVGSIYTGAATAGAAATITDTAQNWPVNILAGRRIKITGGTGQGQEATISSNTATVITVSANWGTAPAASSSTYAVLGQFTRGAGTDLQWADNGINSQTPNARYMYCARGGAVVGFDRFDLTNDSCTLLSVTPQATTLTTGAQYAYDGKNRLYFTKIDADQQRIYYLDLTTYQVHGGSVVPFAVASALASNRMEIFHTKDGIPYLWIQNTGGFTFFMVMLFW